MPLVPLKIPPGVFRNGTNYQSSGRWYDANLVRFFEKTIRPIGGWIRISSTPLTGTCRGIHAWADNSEGKWCGLGTVSKLYAYGGGQISDITPVGFVSGREDSGPGVGYGFGIYGSGNYGESQSASTPLEATTWSMDNWGQYLVACSISDGKLYEWQLVTATPAAVITNAPTQCRALVVTPERHLVALGAGGDPRKVQWCSQGDNTIWTPSATNTAGDLNIQTDGKLLSGRRVRGSVLIWTTQDVHIMNYLGAPLVYGIQRVGSSCGAIGANAMAVIDQGAFWMAKNAFYLYDGTVTPIPCDISDYVFGDLNLAEGAKVFCGVNHQFGEIWWFYPSASSPEVNRYAIYNYREGHWNIGSGLVRTAWADQGVFQYPLAVDTSSYFYEQETTWLDNGSPITTSRYLQGGPLEISPGNRVMHIKRIMPDELTGGQVRMRFTTKFAPEGDSSEFGPYSLSAFTDTRLTARQVAAKIEGVADADWRVGVVRLDVVQGGLR